ncbi:hypothetical protein [Nocardia abscessus]|uniref:hypothetical protein n=1 Tax=Nocardia abscessus TaxID=120957 RepID=UPI00245724E0|nr:hypothetical protein [Nocardia abscessus]
MLLRRDFHTHPGTLIMPLCTLYAPRPLMWGVAGVQIDPVTLTDAARVLEFIADDVKDPVKTPRLDAADCIKSLRDSPIATALGDADGASEQAKIVMEKRYRWMAHLLYLTATTFHGVDVDLANQLNAMGELN